MSPVSDELRANSLEELIRAELANTPIEFWKDFFPIYAAVWRFIERTWPGTLGEIRAGYDTEPCFEGSGAHWFTDMLIPDERVIDSIDVVMREVVEALRSVLPGRDSLRLDEIPPLNRDEVRRMAEAVAKRVEEAQRSDAFRR